MTDNPTDETQRSRPRTGAHTPAKRRGLCVHPVVAARRATRRRLEDQGEAGFTLIEVLIVVLILPIVLGGIAVALLSVFGLQVQTQNRIGNSNDALVSSSFFNQDVQSAQQIETATTPACGTTGQTQLLGLEWALDANGNYDTVVSYVLTPAPAPHSNTNWLIRQVCVAPPAPPSTTPTSSRVVSKDVASLCTSTPCGSGVTALTFNPTGFIGSNAPWQSTQGLYGVTVGVAALNSGYSYTLSGLPSASTSTGSASLIQPVQSPAGCNLANPNSGPNSLQLCFADFTSFTGANTCPSGGGQQMTESIVGSPDLLKFCVSVSGSPMAPHVIPTYYNPGSAGYNSEAYLGNNGFYTGISGEPALYQTSSSAPYSVVSFTNIEVTNAVGEPATGWTLVTGDAESTDNGEWMNFTTNLTWSIFPNSSTSLYGNSCFDDKDPGNSGLFQWTGPLPPTNTTVGDASSRPPSTLYATTLATPVAPNYTTGASSILCEADIQLNKTGTLMLASPEPANSAPQSLTVTMRGAGLQALFLGVLV